jgi:hypothetical protein
MWTRIALYTVLGYTLDALGAHWDTWGFWCILGLFWASEHMTRIETVDRIWEEVEAVRRAKGKNND